jgi:parallel beta-helix repeat protein
VYVITFSRPSMRVRRSFAEQNDLGHFGAAYRRLIVQRHRCLCAVVLLLSLIFLCLVPSAKAATINVPSGQPTIQGGINAANNGDTVLVAPGTYYENIDFEGKAITVASSAGAATTVIDGGAVLGRATVRFMSGEQRNSVLSGFTVQNGGNATFSSLEAGGVFVDGTAPTILNNLVTGNACSGIYVSFGAPLIEGNSISNTQDPNDDYCEFAGSGLGIGGTHAGGGSIVIGNTIENNKEGVANGGGIGIFYAEGCVFQNNVIRNNVSGVGGISVDGTDGLIFVQNLVYGNAAVGEINSSPTGGGGLTIGVPGNGPAPYYGVIANNTFFNNTVSSTEYVSSQVYLDGDISQFLFANNIVYGLGTFPAIACSGHYSYLSPTPVVVDHNDVFNPSGPTYTGLCSAETGANGNISADPLFANSGSGDFHLLSGSPAIGSGDTSVVADLATRNISLTTDLDGNPRIRNAAIDMGPYEYVPTPDFSITALPASLTVVPGQGGTSTISITPVNGFNSSVSFSCSGSPVGTTCSFAPVAVTPSGAAISTTLTLTASISASNHPPSPFRYIPVAALAFSLGFVRFKNHRWCSQWILCVAATLCLTCVSACSSGSSNSGTSNSGGGGSTSTPESGTVTVTATSGSLSHSTSINVVVN